MPGVISKREAQVKRILEDQRATAQQKIKALGSLKIGELNVKRRCAGCIKKRENQRKLINQIVDYEIKKLKEANGIVE